MLPSLTPATKKEKLALKSWRRVARSRWGVSACSSRLFWAVVCGVFGEFDVDFALGAAGLGGNASSTSSVSVCVAIVGRTLSFGG